MLELSLHVLDIAENSTRAGASMVTIRIVEDHAIDLLRLEITDNGKGMNDEELHKAKDPFYTSKKVRKIGLGLPMLAQAAEKADGAFFIESKAGKGTEVMVNFRLSHIDRQPLGDIASTMTTLIAGNPEIDFVYRHECGAAGWYEFDTREVRKELEDIPLNQIDVLNFIRENINEGLKDIAAAA